jgi:hypothetical protein
MSLVEEEEPVERSTCSLFKDLKTAHIIVENFRKKEKEKQLEFNQKALSFNNMIIELETHKLKNIRLQKAMQKQRKYNEKEKAQMKREICELQEDKFEEISKQVKLKNVAESKVSHLVEKCQKLEAENNNYKIVLSKNESAISNVLNINVVLNQKIEALIEGVTNANTTINNSRKKEEEIQLETEQTKISFEKLIIKMKEEIKDLTNKQNRVVFDLKREKEDLETAVIERESRLIDLEAQLTEESLKNENLEERVVVIKQENDCIEPRLAEMVSNLSQEFLQKETELNLKLEKCEKKLNTIESVINGPTVDKLQKVMELFQSNFESLKTEEIQMKTEPMD